MKRRLFFRKISILLASAAGAIAGISFLRQLAPQSIGRNSNVKVGKISDFPVDTFTYVDAHKIFVYRDHEAMKAVSAVCTHLGCTILRTTDGFECPCHGSCYNEEGEVLSGPAPRALAWYALEKSPDGSIIVKLNHASDAEEKFFIT